MTTSSWLAGSWLVAGLKAVKLKLAGHRWYDWGFLPIGKKLTSGWLVVSYLLGLWKVIGWLLGNDSQAWMVPVPDGKGWTIYYRF